MYMNYHHALNNRTKDHIMNKSEQKLLRLIRYFMANLTLVALALITFASCQKSDSPVNQVIRLADRNYTFSNGVVPRNVLESYLSRSITQAAVLVSDGFFTDGPYLHRDDDTRMMQYAVAKFVGRAIYSCTIPQPL